MSRRIKIHCFKFLTIWDCFFQNLENKNRSAALSSRINLHGEDLWPEKQFSQQWPSRAPTCWEETENLGGKLRNLRGNNSEWSQPGRKPHNQNHLVLKWDPVPGFVSNNRNATYHHLLTIPNWLVVLQEDLSNDRYFKSRIKVSAKCRLHNYLQ